MSNRPKPTIVVFAKDVARLARFYAAVAEMTELHRDEDHVVLDEAAYQLVVHGIPAHIAAGIDIGQPPEVREDVPIKVCFPVSSIEHARRRAAQLGGQVAPSSREWEARGLRACDGFDPEGNVFQLREPAQRLERP